MSTSIGTLNIDVLANIAEMVSNLEKGHGEIKKFAEHAKESLEGVHEAFKMLGEIAGISLGVEAFKEIISHAAEAAEQIEHLSQSTGFTVATLQTMKFAAIETGTSLDVAQGAMHKLERSAVQAASGNKQMEEAFRAIGITATQVKELLKDPDKLIQEVTTHIAEFGNGAGKTAVTMQLMGRGAAENIPLINKLGEGWAHLTQEAEKFGIVLSHGDQEQLVGVAESMNSLKAAAAGMANEFTVALAPAIQGVLDLLIDIATSDAAKGFFKWLGDNVREAIVLWRQLGEVFGEAKDWFVSLLDQIGVLDKIKKGFAEMHLDIAGSIADFYNDLDRIITGFKNLGVSIEAGLTVAWTAVKNGLGEALQWMEREIASFASNIASKLNVLTDPSGMWRSMLNGLSTSLSQAADSFKPATANLEKFRTQQDLNNLDLAISIKENNAWAQGIRDAAKEVKAHGDAVESAKKPLIDFNGAIAQAQAAAEGLRKELVKADEMLEQLAAKSGGPYAKAMSEYRLTLEKINAEAALLKVKGADLVTIQRFVAEATQYAKERLDEQTNATRLLDDVIGKFNLKLAAESDLLAHTGIDAEIVKKQNEFLNEAVKALTGSMGPLTEAQQRQIEIELKQIDTTVRVDDATKKSIEVHKQWVDIVKNGFDSFGKTLADFATGGIKTWHDFGKALLDDARQFVAAIIEQFLKLEILNPIINSLFNLSGGNALPMSQGGGLLGMVTGGGGGGGGSGLMSLFGGGGGAGGGFGGFGNLASSVGSLFGAGGSQSLLGSLAGSGEWDIGGAFGGNLGAWGGALGGAFGGYQLGQALGLGKGGSLALGAGVGALSYFIPVVGWIMGAASLVNSLTGGGLFGTQWKPTGNSSSDISLGPGGGSVQDFIEESKKKALFGGRKWKDLSVPATPEQISAVDQMFKQLQQSIKAGADALGVQAGDIISGSFKQTFDKSGKVTAELSTVLGQTYKETIQQFATRITADNLLALLPAAQNAMQIASKWQQSAEMLMAGTQFLVQAQIDINHGRGLLGSNDSLADIDKEVEKLAVSGESLIQSYVRLQTELQSFTNITDMLGLSSSKTGADLLEFADSLAKSAGGIQNLTALWNAYYGDYYSQAEQQANTVKMLQKQVTADFKAIGEDPTESMATFREHFTAIFDTLTPEQVKQWLEAGVALAQLNKALGQTSQVATQANQQSMQAYRDYMAQFGGPVLSSFESSMLKLGDTLKTSEAKANELAKAAGLAGASNADLGKILADSARQGAAAIAQFAQQIQQLAQSLYGTSIDALNKQLASAKSNLASADQFGMSQYWQGQVNKIQSQIDAANAQAEQQKRFADATTLLGNLGQFGAVTGKGLNELANKFGIPLDKFAVDLGLTTEQLKESFNQQEQIAQAALKTNDWLQQILAALQGKSAFATATTGISLHGRPINEPQPVKLTAESQAKLDQIHTVLQNILISSNNGVEINRQMVRQGERNAIQPMPIGQRNVRTMVP